VVMNKIDDNPSYNVEQNRINHDFPFIENRFLRLSCRTQDGLPELIKTLAQTIPATSLFGTEISQRWMTIKERLVHETGQHRYINRERFQAICQEEGVEDESSQHTLLQYLNDLGIVLYFKQLNLSNIYVLDPHWVTIGVYKIINSQQASDGILDETALDFILNQEQIKKDEYDPAREKFMAYTLEEQRYILAIMMQFQLCYEYYIVPDLLPKELAQEPMLDEGETLCFIMEYDYLPTSIISRVMLRFKNDIEPGLQWRYGMILANGDSGCRAKIQSDEQHRTITITVQGESIRKREYFSAIRHCIADLNSEFENLQIDELIPLPGYPNAQVDYQVLLGHEQTGRAKYFDGKLMQEFAVAPLLDSVASPAERSQERGARQFHIHGDMNTFQENIWDSYVETRPADTTDSVDVEKMKALRKEEVQLQEELEAVRKLKQHCESEARSQVERRRWWLIGINIVIFVGLLWLIYDWGWDDAEQYTFIVPTGFSLLQSVVAIIWYRRAYIGDAFERSLQVATEKQYAKHRYVKRKHERLAGELARVESDIRNL